MRLLMDERDAELAQIARTYREYEATGRDRLWDLRNRGYARLVGDRDRRLVQLFRTCARPDAGRILDLGCGDGSLATLVANSGLPLTSWTGVDLDPAAVARARIAVPWAEFVEASADRLPFESPAFDIVVASTLFSSLPSATLEQEVANEIARVITSDGWLIYYDLRYDNPANPAVHGIGEARLDELFPSWRREVRPITLLPPLARRLGRLTPLLYPVLHAVRPLRSHLIGRLSPSR